jgi:hypothetical protein
MGEFGNYFVLSKKISNPKVAQKFFPPEFCPKKGSTNGNRFLILLFL